jgi:hypothetical protein
MSTAKFEGKDFPTHGLTGPKPTGQPCVIAETRQMDNQ